ncbi:helix-turn-helix transcriptional regulator [Draconibacterium sp. IB214405]|uniref:helix-turn-helix domain-containing protein n=1 Tax=Draconibacterium sp. IB214405 TaxID=3097352 RepID=UPI002A120218|nr:helix-turn-helix transcriptional regulator [Draconibacterium sp. IB214405]MDX8339571.1 helix-turn-helix transcriptional regulator [Draconibacterium sp. IB214405]
MKDRIKNFIEAKGISAGELAAVLDVQRSNISHILNGRNKPGASFIERLLVEFPDLNARWLLTGQGDMFNGEAPVTISPQQKLPIVEEAVSKHPVIENTTKEKDVVNDPIKSSTEVLSTEVDKMIIIYRDGTFDIYKQR